MELLFNKLDKGTEEVAQIATWTSNHNYQHIEKALILAKRKVVKIIGKDTYNVALEHYLSEDYQYVAPETPPAEPPTEEEIAEWKKLDTLVFWFQTVLVNFAYSKNIYKDTVIWNNAGINVTWSDQFRPAQQQTLDNLSESFDKDGYEFLDLLIEFLNDNKKQFPEFQTSIEGLKLKELFIPTADEFNYYFNIKNSVSYFFEILDVIRRVQRSDIKNCLTTEWYNKAIEYQKNIIDIENSDYQVEIIDDLNPISETRTIAWVKDIDKYYIKTDTEWIFLAYNCAGLLDIIKPTLVDLTIYTKFLSDFTNIKAEQKQIEILRANANYLKQKADAGLAKIVQYIELLEVVEDTEITEETSNNYFSTNNSFMM